MSDEINRPPALTQPQREAIFDLLLFAMYADDALKIQEDERINLIVSKLGWESYQEPRAYSELAIARMRAEHESMYAVEPFLATVAAILETREKKQFALHMLEQLLESDGMIVDSEHKLHEKATAVFGF